MMFDSLVTLCRAALRPPSLCVALRFWGLVTVTGGAVSLASCEGEPEAQVRAEFGVFYGGQLQQRREIPFTLDQTKQSQGFVISLSKPTASEARLAWELSVPEGSTENAPASPSERKARLGEDRLLPGIARYEKRLHFQPGDGLGLYNIRITLNDRLLLDKAFHVYNPHTRRRNRRRNARTSTDAGF